MIDGRQQKRPLALAILLITTGDVGLYAAFELTLAKLDVLADPQATLNCNFSLIVQCGVNLASTQGAVFGFPNPLIGLVCFPAPILVGTALLAGARFARWFWLTFNAGVVLALVFVIWLLSQSIYVLGTLCPWCMVVWAAVIPMFWGVTLYTLSNHLGQGLQRTRGFFAGAYGWVPLLTLLSYLLIAVLAQLRLDVLVYLINR